MYIIKLYYKQSHNYIVTRIKQTFTTEKEAEKTIKARQSQFEKDKTETMRQNGELPNNGFYLKEAYAYIQTI